MHPCNILIGCDQTYYDDWGVTLLQSIHYYNPWISLNCHIVNPNNLIKLDYVNYTFEQMSFTNNDSKISYLQAVRFLAADKFFNETQYVLSIDADSICTKEFTEQEFLSLFDTTTILQHPKDGRWLAGFVTLAPSMFRKEYAELLMSDSVDTWVFGRDQTIMANLAEKYNFTPVSKKWISIGKNGVGSIFLTLKGDQKYSKKYLPLYHQYKKDTQH
jgi:hypothetical protein